LLILSSVLFEVDPRHEAYQVTLQFIFCNFIRRNRAWGTCPLAHQFIQGARYHEVD